MRTREQLRKLRALLRDDSAETVAQGVALARSLGPKAQAKMLEGCRLDALGRPELGPFFRAPDALAPQLLHAFLAIAPHVAEETARDDSLRAPEMLELDGERLPRWPDDLGAWEPSVVVLQLRRCWLRALPPFALRLPALRGLHLDHNQLEALPDLSGLAALRHLRLRHNRLRALEEDALPAGLEQLDLRDTALRALPRSLGRLDALRELWVSGGQLETVPAELGDCAALRELALTGVGLRAVPRSLGRLGQLRTLDLSDNELARLPDELGACAALEDLDVGRNQLLQLPASLGRLARLRRLRAGFNRLTRLPAELGEAKALRLLAVPSNPITRLPSAQEGGLGGLRHLDVSRTHLDALDLEAFPRLTTLLANDTPLIALHGLEGASRLRQLEARNAPLDAATRSALTSREGLQLALG
ncbi:MAG TPA: hypothetical protein RMH85_25330 [Polyangiaceae bacterium LLY-WYZ-15_(1-7)]|nr:hypothetical protein [Myxococcales bacterium]MAT25111.1 hypothetical protein [Sandaracinus sp.]HJK95472.1 hypothetical protein [Polyangiaceae bacterium LLY-WYZ-15_(1-7)]HJL04686.1 hypothetical protein [Polyangiaceae bacterium LLY-WYZ-15_(1-7)]HJL11823.1 hypothetical protein [Polyangiaceae bacterium LLY-WYZ-15_(1-7)]